MFWAMALVGLVVVWCLFAVGKSDADNTLLWNIFFIAWPALMVRRILILWGMALVGLAAVWGLYAMGKSEEDGPLWSSLFLVVVPAVVTWRTRGMRKGTVKLIGEGLFVDGGRWRSETYEWKDIAEARLITPAELGTYDRLRLRMGGIGENAPFVEVKMSRSRLPLVWDRWGTLWGIPGLGFKRVRLFVTDPEGFVRAAQPFLRRPLDAGHI